MFSRSIVTSTQSTLETQNKRGHYLNYAPHIELRESAFISLRQSRLFELLNKIHDYRRKTRHEQLNNQNIAANKIVVQNWYNAVAQFDLPTLPKLVDPDLQWNQPETFIPNARPQENQYQGGSYVTETYLPNYFKHCDYYIMEPTQWICEGDTVATFGRYRVKLKGDDKEITFPFAHLWKIRNSKIYFYINVAESQPLNEAFEKLKQ